MSLETGARPKRLLAFGAPWLLVSLLGASGNAQDASKALVVTLLGTGNPRPSIERFGPSFLLEAGGRRILIDAGRGATIRLSEIGVSSADVEAVLLTHLHSDHVVGLPDVWLTGWLFGRSVPLVVVGPKGLQSLVQGLEQAFAFDVHMRRDEDEHLSPNGVRFLDREVEEGEAYRTPEGLVLTAFAVDHGLVHPALGYRADFAGHSVVFSGDTRPSENLIRHARGADVLIHEVISEKLEREGSLTPGITEQVMARHTTIEQAAAIFSEARPRLAVYAHIVPSTAGEADLVPLTREHYKGALQVGYDLMQIVIGSTLRVVDRRPGH